MFALRSLRSVIGWTRAFSTLPLSRSVAIINVPFSGGQPRDGVDLAPNFLQDLGFYERLEKLGLNVHTVSDVNIDYLDDEAKSKMYIHNKLVKNPVTCGNVCKQTAESVLHALKEGQMPIVIGGDHSIATGTAFGHYLFNEDTCLLWVDAHADINSPLVTTSGNVHGMPVSWLISNFPHFPKVPGYEWVHRCIAPEKVAYVGLRDVEPQERDLLKQLGLKAFFIEDIDELGIVVTMERALQAINPMNDCPIHVSFDIDAMDPDVAPTTGTTVRGGLTLSEGLYISQRVAQTGKLQGLDLVEINPKLGDGIEAVLTANTGMALVEAMLGVPQNIPQQDLVPHNQNKEKIVEK